MRNSPQVHDNYLSLDLFGIKISIGSNDNSRQVGTKSKGYEPDEFQPPAKKPKIDSQQNTPTGSDFFKNISTAISTSFAGSSSNTYGSNSSNAKITPPAISNTSKTLDQKIEIARVIASYHTSENIRFYKTPNRANTVIISNFLLNQDISKLDTNEILNQCQLTSKIAHYGQQPKHDSIIQNLSLTSSQINEIIRYANMEKTIERTERENNTRRSQPTSNSSRRGAGTMQRSQSTSDLEAKERASENERTMQRSQSTSDLEAKERASENERTMRRSQSTIHSVSARERERRNGETTETKQTIKSRNSSIPGNSPTKPRSQSALDLRPLKQSNYPSTRETRNPGDHNPIRIDGNKYNPTFSKDGHLSGYKQQGPWANTVRTLTRINFIGDRCGR